MLRRKRTGFKTGTKKWLSTQDDSLVDEVPYYFTGVGDEIGPIHWDLRQGEWEGEFYIQLPGGRTAVARLNGGYATDNTTVQLQTRLNTFSASTSYDLWSFKSVEERPSATIAQPLSYGATLKTGTFKSTKPPDKTHQRKTPPTDENVPYHV